MALLNTWASQQDQATLSPLSRLLNNYIQKGDAPLAYLMRGDAQGLLKDLNTPKPVNTTQDMTDLALNLVGSINPIGNVTKGLLSKTQFEKAQEIASKNAETLLGLPKGNTAMDRAKAMGFDINTPLYHGTTSDIKAFDPAMIGKNFKEISGGTYSTTSPFEASKYTESTGIDKIIDRNITGGNVMPLLAKNTDVLNVNVNDRFVTKYLDKNIDKLIQKAELKNKKAIYAKPLQQRTDLINEMYGLPPSNFDDINNYIALDPSQYRSRFAAFDPARANEPDLLAAALAIPVSGLLEQPKDKKKKK